MLYLLGVYIHTMNYIYKDKYLALVLEWVICVNKSKINFYLYKFIQS